MPATGPIGLIGLIWPIRPIRLISRDCCRRDAGTPRGPTGTRRGETSAWEVGGR
jgi:hypothetical protein